jgi:hypothetical protein
MLNRMRCSPVDNCQIGRKARCSKNSTPMIAQIDDVTGVASIAVHPPSSTMPPIAAMISSRKRICTDSFHTAYVYRGAAPGHDQVEGSISVVCRDCQISPGREYHQHLSLFVIISHLLRVFNERIKPYTQPPGPLLYSQSLGREKGEPPTAGVTRETNITCSQALDAIDTLTTLIIETVARGGARHPTGPWLFR